MLLGRDVAIRSSGRRGRGLYALRDLEEGELIGRYRGQILSDDEYQSSSSTGVYAMQLPNGRVIDGEDEGRSSFLRYMNHSKRLANCVACEETFFSGMLASVHIETTQPVSKGDELLFEFAFLVFEP